jgi:hypothetical protein
MKDMKNDERGGNKPDKSSMATKRFAFAASAWL